MNKEVKEKLKTVLVEATKKCVNCKHCKYRRYYGANECLEALYADEILKNNEVFVWHKETPKPYLMKIVHYGNNLYTKAFYSKKLNCWLNDKGKINNVIAWMELPKK